MQFTAVAAFLAAVASVSASTVYVTDVVTITSCGSYVTDCPAHSTVTKTTSYLTTTTVAASYYNTTSAYAPPPYVTQTYAPVVVKPTTTAPILSVITISTCLPTVIYSTVTVQPTTTPVPVYAPVSTKGAPAPSGTGVVAPYPPFKGAASHVTGSVYLAGVAMAAFLFA